MAPYSLKTYARWNFLALDFRAVDFLALDFRPVDFLALDFRALDFLALDFRPVDFRLAFDFRDDGGLWPPARAAFPLTASAASSALSTAISSNLSTTAPTTPCAVSVARTFFPVFLTGSVTFPRLGSDVLRFLHPIESVLVLIVNNLPDSEEPKPTVRLLVIEFKSRRVAGVSEKGGPMIAALGGIGIVGIVVLVIVVLVIFYFVRR